MDDADFDQKLVTAAFALGSTEGWARVSVVRAARDAGLPLAEARLRCPSRGAILLKFGRLADQAALATDANGAAAGESARDRLFDLLMQRLEFLQAHRDGVLALLRDLPRDPPLALLLAAASRRSMAWMLEAAGIDSTGLEGALRASGALAVWLWTVRAWQRDDSADLSSTMTALDRALSRAEQAAGWLPRTGVTVPAGMAFETADGEPAMAEPATPQPAVEPEIKAPETPAPVAGLVADEAADRPVTRPDAPSGAGA
jgi:hypothetical protein